MAGKGPFLWLSKGESPYGFWELSRGGMCMSAFPFMKRGSKILLGKYADDARWETLPGLDGGRRRAHGTRPRNGADGDRAATSPTAAIVTAERERLSRDPLRDRTF